MLPVFGVPRKPPPTDMYVNSTSGWLLRKVAISRPFSVVYSRREPGGTRNDTVNSLVSASGIQVKPSFGHECERREDRAGRATASTGPRRCSATSSQRGYRSATRSNQPLNANATRRTGFFVVCRCDSPCPVISSSGSCQTLESIGSSVNETNSDTSTANATVTPNWKKIRPIMPPMNATGMNTATTASVVDSTASPISSVPSFDART